MLNEDLKKISSKLRALALEAIYNGGSGHPGGSLSLADIMAVLYFDVMKIDPKDPKKADRDRFVLSKGHAAPILYASLALRGFIPQEDLKTLRHIDSYLQGHPDMKHTNGVDMSTGSLGQGISAACGMALAGLRQKLDYHVYAVLGDGECDEGQVWEAVMFANQYKLHNLTIILDHNGLQIDGSNNEVISLDHLKERFEAFGLHTIEINGNDIDEIKQGLDSCLAYKDGASVIIADTVKGKGVDFMENQVGWHGKAPNADEYAKAMAQLGE